MVLPLATISIVVAQLRFYNLKSVSFDRTREKFQFKVSGDEYTVGVGQYGEVIYKLAKSDPSTIGLENLVWLKRELFKQIRV
jgi:hypothetical protein